MAFSKENFKVLAKPQNESVLFEADSVVRSLGFTTVAKSGNVCVRWNRVNEYLKNYTNMPISKGSMIPERMVYKLAFKANNELAEAFQDWLATEVLPSIHKTGSYSRKQAEQTKLYEYIPKTYYGVSVLTVLDLQHFTGIQAHTITYQVRESKRFAKGKDYYFLEKDTLLKFKQENPKFTKLASSVYVITKSGFDKLAKLFDGAPKELECYKNAPILPVTQTFKKREYSDIPDNKSAQKYIEKLKDYITALDVMLRLYNRYNEVETQKELGKNLFTLGAEVAAVSSHFENLQYGVTDKKY